MSKANALGKLWNSIVHPFVDFRTSATLGRNANGAQCIRLVRSRCGRDKYGTELAYEVDHAIIVLHGERPTYEGGQFELAEGHSDLNLSKFGSVQVDREQRKLEVRVAIAGKPWRFNGVYSFDESAA